MWNRTEHLKKYELTQTSILNLLERQLKGRRVRILPLDKRQKNIPEGVVKSVDTDGEVDEGNWVVLEFEDGTSHSLQFWQDIEVLPNSMSRQRAYQIRQNAKGLCSMCNEPLATAKLCEGHRLKRSERDIANRKRKKA
jgi:hypothetical protein